jgi:DNA-nicking Smr family endonuclease
MQAPTIGWVATGDALNAEYKQKREAAIAAAVQRNRLFDLATKAYRRGDKKAARDLSAQGKRFQAEMEELHAEAAAGIFKARNSNGRADVLDLHGLHPDEAVEIVTKHVQTVRRDAKNRKERTFTVITGTGHHAASTAHRSKLRDAVVECLDRLHCLHRDTSPDQRGGMISVVVTNNNTPNSKKR